jgi:hypothetical protein
MTEEKKEWNRDNFDEKMKQSQNELTELRAHLQDLLVKFGLRALRVYQAARNEPLRSNETERLIRYELQNVINDLSEKNALDQIVKQAKLEWEKQQGTQAAFT